MQILGGVQELLNTPNAKDFAQAGAGTLFVKDRKAYEKKVGDLVMDKIFDYVRPSGGKLQRTRIQ